MNVSFVIIKFIFILLLCIEKKFSLFGICKFLSKCSNCSFNEESKLFVL